MPRRQPSVGAALLRFDRSMLNGAGSMAGIDEAGRGALAGPVCAAAAIADAAFFDRPWTRKACRAVDDSKRLSADQRAAIVASFHHAIDHGWLRVGIGWGDTDAIDRLNILGATILAMTRALHAAIATSTASAITGSSTAPATIPAATDMPLLIDGRPLKRFPYPHIGIVKGDRTSLLIALAGIHAKQARDEHMRQLHATWPHYGFAIHKGYATASHCEALRANGPCPAHRSLFLRKILGTATAGQAPLTQGSLFSDTCPTTTPSSECTPP